MSHILILTTLPDEDSARNVAQALLADRLAACVTVGAPVESMYHWQGAIETAREVPLTAKTRLDLFGAASEAIRGRHPYELPEIVAVPISDGSPAYLAWIDTQTRR
ncbi:MAG TPA: divalent-cation tolerance protein CutA [Casimicrobiaceae bacterium]|nr:divalent-cation tolerance protein CutA [Casimicrobiaceae bacterium]